MTRSHVSHMPKTGKVTPGAAQRAAEVLPGMSRIYRSIDTGSRVLYLYALEYFNRALPGYP